MAGVHVPGHAPGTCETDLLSPTAHVEKVHGVLLTGGSAFGLAAATGVIRWLAENGYGHQTFHGRVPLVPGAVVFDLFFNKTQGKPDEAMGYQAASIASSDPVAMGCVGAGTGVTAGKLAGFDRAMKSGLGSAAMDFGKIKVGAIAVVNPIGNVIDPVTRQVLAGARKPDGSGFLNEMEILQAMERLVSVRAGMNTVLGLVATNAVLSNVQATRVARMASAGMARTIWPANTMFDGDIVFALASGTGPPADESVVGALGAEVLGQAIAAGARAAESAPGIPAYKDMPH